MFVIVHVDRRKKSVKRLFQMWVDRYAIRCLSNSDEVRRASKKMLQNKTKQITKQNTKHKTKQSTKHKTLNFSRNLLQTLKQTNSFSPTDIVFKYN